MASQHIEISSTASRLSADWRRAIDNTRALQELIVKVKDISDQVASGGKTRCAGNTPHANKILLPIE